MESSTKILRRMLDERGVEYDTDDEDGCEFTEWVANGLEWEADSRGELVSLMPVMLITPEQAIAATLGSSNCSSNCTNGERTETCHDKGTFKSWGFFTCSNCSIVFPLDAVRDAPSIGRTLPPKYCPNCGRHIVEPTTNDVDAEVEQ